MDLTNLVGQQPPGSKVMSGSSHRQGQEMGQVNSEMMELIGMIGVKRERQEYPNLYSSVDEAPDNVTVININPAEGEQQGEAFDINLEELTQGAEPGDFKQQQPGQQGSMVVYSTLEQQQSLDSTSSPPAPRSSSPSPPEEEAEGGEEAGAASPPDLASWVRETYPSLHQVWHQTSGSSFFQGGVELLCSSCRQRPAAGFHSGLPLCEEDRVSKKTTCTVCRLRPSSGFHYGLAMCSGDRQFLAQSLGTSLLYSPCNKECPPSTLSPWCHYCRLATCMKEKGLRLSTSALPCPSPEDGGTCLQSNTTQEPTDPQNSAIFKELSFPTPAPPTSLPNFKMKPYDNPGARAAPYPASYSRAVSYSATSPHQPTRSPTPSPAPNVTVPHPVNHTQSLPPTSYPPNSFLPSPYPSQASPRALQQPSRPLSTYNPQPAPHDLSRPTAPQTPSYYLPPAQPAPSYYRPPAYPFFRPQVVPVKQEYYDGSSLGLENARPATRGVLQDPARQGWLRYQQESYLKHHLALYWSRKKKSLGEGSQN